LNLVRDEIRRAGRRPDHVALCEDDPPWERSPLDLLLGRQLWQRFLSAFKAMEPRDRGAIVGRFYRGLSYEALQVLLDTPSPDAARVTVARAARRLAEAMLEQRRRGQKRVRSGRARRARR
jgi:DNA-directed RNA polymerase specialized sigma24 family protein